MPVACGSNLLLYWCSFVFPVLLKVSVPSPTANESWPEVQVMGQAPAEKAQGRHRKAVPQLRRNIAFWFEHC